MGQNAPATETPPAPPAPQQPSPIDPAEFARLQQQNAQQARDLALAQARADFPNADKDLLGMFQGSPEDLRKMAETLHTKESERLAALSRTPGLAPTPGPGGTPSPEDAQRARYQELRTKVLGRYAEPFEREEFEKLGYAALWNGHMADRRDGKSSSNGVRI